jgi:aspartate aminotransferase
LEAIEGAINSQTKAVLINSPNNPTGQVYDHQSLAELGDLLSAGSRKLGKSIYLISDEPYRKIVYDGLAVPGILDCYPNSIVVSSYSKDISLPGERLGFLVVHPGADRVEALLAGMVLANRILGFVNAPALMQRVIKHLQGHCVDIAIYQTRRDRFCQGLAEAGYEFVRPRGAFYLFPKSPISDDVAFVQILQEEKILVVPGSGFGGPGYFRISYCVDQRTIDGSIPGFARAYRKAVT